MKKPRLINAKTMHKKHPHTFSIPSNEELKNISKGDYVKVSLKKERFWVLITKVIGNKLTGDIDNELIKTKMYKYGDLIEFSKNNVYDIKSKSYCVIS